MMDRYRDAAAKSDTSSMDPNKKFKRQQKFPMLARGKQDPARAALHGLKVKVPATNEAAKPDFLDFDKDGNTKEPMTKALKDKKAKKTTENIIKESLQRFLREGEEGKAEVIMAVKDMVDKFTSWSEDIAQMQANTAMELADSIRDELGSDVSEQFKQAVGPALDQAFQAVKAARESINGMVGSITGEAPPSGSEEMGAEPPAGDADTGAEEPAGDIDTGAEAPAPAPEAEPADLGREKRESVERTRRLSKILVGR
jgi:hypothetical protein